MPMLVLIGPTASPEKLAVPVEFVPLLGEQGGETQVGNNCRTGVSKFPSTIALYNAAGAAAVHWGPAIDITITHCPSRGTVHNSRCNRSNRLTNGYGKRVCKSRVIR